MWNTDGLTCYWSQFSSRCNLESVHAGILLTKCCPFLQLLPASSHDCRGVLGLSDHAVSRACQPMNISGSQPVTGLPHKREGKNKSVHMHFMLSISPPKSCAHALQHVSQFRLTPTMDISLHHAPVPPHAAMIWKQVGGFSSHAVVLHFCPGRDVTLLHVCCDLFSSSRLCASYLQLCHTTLLIARSMQRGTILACLRVWKGYHVVLVAILIYTSWGHPRFPPGSAGSCSSSGLLSTPQQSHQTPLLQ